MNTISVFRIHLHVIFVWTKYEEERKKEPNNFKNCAFAYGEFAYTSTSTYHMHDNIWASMQINKS